MVIEDEWFDDMNSTDGTTFPTALITRKKKSQSKNDFFAGHLLAYTVIFNKQWLEHIDCAYTT